MIQANEAQLAASNPFISAWVAASAGSGKTTVLTDRVLNLMLMSGEPEKILCLTFTKVAAAEMSNRLTTILKRWSTLDTSNLTQELQNLNSETPSEETLQRARTLFAKVLETPGGLKMMTIHSFCTSVLHRFPLEANVPPNFTVLDELSTQTLMQQSLNKVLESSDIIPHIQYLATLISQDDLISALTNILGKRSDIYDLINKYNGLDGFIQQIKQFFNIEKYITIDEIISEHFTSDTWPDAQELYLTKAGQIRKKVKDPIQAEYAYQTLEKIKSWHTVQVNYALFSLVFRILEIYQQEKFKISALDYDDLIDKTRELLSTKENTAWVLYKLDGGLDHILVDEAQDTNPKQWEIIAALCDEFFAGEGKTDKLRTLFVVGDKKQSIYSFQGARPDEFEQRHRYFEQKIKDSQNEFETIPFNFSFRSTQPVLDLVNRILKNPIATQGVISEHEDATHLAKRNQDAGLVEIWPVEMPPAETDDQKWQLPTVRTQSLSAMNRLAQKIAIKIADMIQSGEILPSKGRPVQAGDFLILLQKRGNFMTELVRALKEQNVPVAGVDRLDLTEHIAIKDLLALIRFVLLPTDDLNLACLLKSPIIGLSDDDLFKICVNRGKQTVWERIQKLYPDHADTLIRIMNLADQTPPFEFLETIYNEYHGRQKFIARLGMEVNEALDALLDLAIQYESNNCPSLQGFVDLMSHQNITIKRDMDQNGLNAVRIMTVHGSKGLQGNIVFLPDTRGHKTAFKRRENLLWVHDLPLWLPQKNNTPNSLDIYFQQLDDLAFQEKNRLLYVALTRAADQLYICGYNTKTAPQENNWYDLIQNSLGIEHIDHVIQYQSKQKQKISPKALSEIQNDFDAIPSWVRTLPPVAQIPQIITPSNLGNTTSHEGSDNLNARERGTIIHQILQYLPTIPAEQRLSVFHQMIPSQMDISEKLLDLFNHPILCDLFGPNSMSEVPIIGTLNGQQISGQIDRLVIRENDILIIDYKTGRNIPKTIPENYRLQLNMYKDLLKNIFPDKIVKAYILWTENITLVEV